LTKSTNTNITALSNVSSLMIHGISQPNGSKTGAATIHNTVLTDAQLLAYYNNTKAYYGL
jgi:hypothetical protein